MPKKTALDLKGIDEHEDAENAEIEKNFAKDFPYFTSHREDLKAISAFNSKFKPGKWKNLKVFVVEGIDVSAEREFEEGEQGEDEERNVIFFSRNKGRRRAFRSRGYGTEKTGSLERKAQSQGANVLIMLDTPPKLTPHFLHNIAPGGWVLCRVKTANALRTNGKYELKGVIEKGHGAASASKREGHEFWKSHAVDSDESFRGASDSEGEGVVTYAEAEKKVIEAKDKGVPGMHETDIFRSYEKLITMAEEQHPEALEKGQTIIPLTVAIEGEIIELGEINTVLPTKESEHDEDIIVMRKREIV